MLDELPGIFSAIALSPMLVVLAGLLMAAVFGFVAAFVAPALRVSRCLNSLSRNLGHSGQQTAPGSIEIDDKRLGHLWNQYIQTLHLPQQEAGQGVRSHRRYRATVPAEVILNPQSVYEGRIRAEFFKHLPGLLTGIGIIGTFAGLIHGLGTAIDPSGALDPKALIPAVKEAFYVSATAIALAMCITFVEKLLVAKLNTAVEQLCQRIDGLFASGAGEEYLARLVAASEESASQARILKDALVGELASILERLTERQIAAQEQQQKSLQNQLVATINQSLRAPLADLAQGFGQFRSSQGEALTQSLQDSMAAFAVKLEEVLGGQVGQAKDLQQQTLLELEKAILAFQSMATEVGRAGESATQTMSSQLNTAIEDMAAGQRQMTEAMRVFVDELRRALTQTQAEAQKGIEHLLADLGNEVRRTTAALEGGAVATSNAQRQQLEALSQSTEATVVSLADHVRGQTEAIFAATTAMRAAVSELASATSGNVASMNRGADQMRQAAEQFTSSGRVMSEVFEKSRGVSAELSTTSGRLAATSKDIEEVVRDYRAARESFGDIVTSLKGTVDVAKRDASMTTELVSRLETAAQKLLAAQGHADAYLAKLNAVLAQAHASFSDQMLTTVRKTNGEFHDSLRKATGLLASTIADFENALSDNMPKARGRTL